MTLSDQKPLPVLIQSRIWVLVVKSLCLALGFILILALSISLYPPIYILGLALVGQSPVCSSLAAFEGARKLYDGRNRSQEIVARSRLIERDSRGLELWDTPFGRFWIPSGSEEVLPILLAQQASRVYEQPGRVQIKSGDIVFDCGAHVGVFTRKALSQGAALVVAIEPSPLNLECLRRNFVKEVAEGRVVLVPEGVWDRQDVLTFFTNPENSAGDSFLIQSARSSGTLHVPVTTIDKIREDLKLLRVDLIKIDVEGAAERALNGSAKTLREFKPLLAVSTEENTDDPIRISHMVTATQSRYQMECGHCGVQSGTVSPEVLFFY
jgi:FkbM family methyltransferase